MTYNLNESARTVMWIVQEWRTGLQNGYGVYPSTFTLVPDFRTSFVTRVEADLAVALLEAEDVLSGWRMPSSWRS